MRALLSTIGSRGDVQPLIALALELKALGHEARLCVPPDFRESIETLGFAVTPIGPELRKMTASRPPAGSVTTPPSPERLRQLAEASVAAQFETVAAAARDCDIIIAATALQIAARSVAETLSIPYRFVAYCPAVLPSPHHAPPVLGIKGQTPAGPTADTRELWAQNGASFNAMFGAALNAHRSAVGLAPVDDVRSHIFTERPWLAADKTLGPWPDSDDNTVVQTGAWLVADDRPLSPEIEAFLSNGEPPIFFGFGSIRATDGLSDAMVASARAVGRRAIVSRGWADLTIEGEAPDCLVIGEANLQALFGRVAAIVHHGGAGTTTIASLGGAPQVVTPQMYDQYYWAQRVADLGIGVAHAPSAPTAESLTKALGEALRPDVAARARAIAADVRRDGATVAAQLVVAATR